MHSPHVDDEISDFDHFCGRLTHSGVSKRKNAMKIPSIPFNCKSYQNTFYPIKYSTTGQY